MAKSLNQKHVVLTVDEALYPKLLELKWSVEDYNEVLIPCLGGLHVAMNFLGVIGRHMNDSGLVEVWVESDLLGTNAAHQVITGKGYARVIRSKSKIILRGPLSRVSATNFRCCKISHHAFSLPGNNMETSSSTLPKHSPIDRYGLDFGRWTVKTPASFSSTDTESLSGDHFMFLYKRMPEQTLFL